MVTATKGHPAYECTYRTHVLYILFVLDGKHASQKLRRHARTRTAFHCKRTHFSVKMPQLHHTTTHPNTQWAIVWVHVCLSAQSLGQIGAQMLRCPTAQGLERSLGWAFVAGATTIAPTIMSLLPDFLVMLSVVLVSCLETHLVSGVALDDHFGFGVVVFQCKSTIAWTRGGGDWGQSCVKPIKSILETNCIVLPAVQRPHGVFSTRQWVPTWRNEQLPKSSRWEKVLPEGLSPLGRTIEG